MYLCNIDTSSAWTQGQPIALATSPKISTNGNVENNSTNNGSLILNTGWYSVRLEANVTSTGTSIGAELYANGNGIATTTKSITLASGNSGMIVIEYPIHVVAANTTTNALVQFYATQGATPINGFVTITKIQ